jgi:hypothetical protein
MSARAVRRLLLVAALALAAAGPATARVIAGARLPEPRLAGRDLFADRLWDDGRAEISLYEGTIERYGKVRPLKARIIVVKEDMDTLQRVKSATGPGPGTRPVLKQNFIQDFRTGTYDYHQMCSTFLDRATGRVEKLAMTSADGCGITSVEIRTEGGRVSREAHSYWDAQSGHEFVVADAAFLVADALPLWLRRLDLGRTQVFHTRLLPSQISNQVSPLDLPEAKIEVVGRPDRHGLLVRVHVLGGPDWQRESTREDRYWFDPAWPHPLVRFEGGNDPTVLTRVRTIRLAYWNETAPGDERLLEGGR